MQELPLETAEPYDDDLVERELQAALARRHELQASWRSIWKKLPSVFDQYRDTGPEKEIPFSD